MTKARLLEIIELLVAILREVTLAEEQQAILDKICEETGICKN